MDRENDYDSPYGIFVMLVIALGVLAGLYYFDPSLAVKEDTKVSEELAKHCIVSMAQLGLRYKEVIDICK